MSRLGKLPIAIPKGVQVAITDEVFSVKGPKGELEQVIPPAVKITQAGEVLHVTVVHPQNRKERALWGLARQLLANAVKGVYEGFTKKMEINGIGFKAQVEGNDLVLSLGFSHPVRYHIPAGVKITTEKNTIIVTGASKQLVGQTAAEIRALRPPEPYKGKGIRYSDETVRRKAGKVVKAAGAK